jgi:carbon monoxide dehydrogenase subunit G
MELKNDFHVSVPIDVAWAALTDLERVAPCMPGAELKEVEGDEYRGIVKVKVGPISAQYKGSARFVEKDDAQHRAVLLAEGRDSRGQGNASATVTAIATSENGGTTVSLVTELTITGKVAQFGRSVMGDVSAKMLGEFADRLEASVLSEDSGSETKESVAEPVAEPSDQSKGTVPVSAPSEQSEQPSVRTIHSAPAEPVNLLGTAGPSVFKRSLPLVGVLGLISLLWWQRRRRRRSQG